MQVEKYYPMNKKYSLYAIFFLIMSMFAAACSSSSSDDDFVELANPIANSVVVDSFRLVANDTILVGLDCVFFSIDLDRALIYNADSLPKGTDVSALQVTMGIGDASKAEIKMRAKSGNDTIINFLENSTEPINFSDGYVTLHLESYNTEYKRDYKIYVNVHKLDPDTLVWNQLSTGGIPSALASVDTQRTVEHQGKVLCFTKNASSFCLMTTEVPVADWTEESINIPNGARIESITSAESKLFILDADDNLYESTDMGASWIATGVKMSYIYGCVNDTAIGVRNDNGTYVHTTYPESTESITPNGCPIKATSQALIYTTEWSTQPLMIVAGGIDAEGNAVGGTWGYDGTQWTETSIAGLPALESPVIVPYYTFKNNNFWNVTKASVLLAFGGYTADKQNNASVYVSYDFGFHWAKAPQMLQLPESFIPGAYSQALVIEEEHSTIAPASKYWSTPQALNLPAWYQLETASPLATKPITSWDCPYIYVFGGVDAVNGFNNRTYRGVINRLSFKPLQ